MISFEFLILFVYFFKELSNGYFFFSLFEKKKEKKEEFSNLKELFLILRRIE